jgi:phenylacetate-CoA ligase
MMDVYGNLFRSVLLPAWEGSIRNRPTFPLLRYLEQTQWRTLDELTALQTGALRRLVRHATTNVPFYRKRFADAGLTAESIREPADLLRLPPLTRDDARTSFAERESMAPPFVAIKKNTGGTTAEPLLFGYDRGSEAWRQATKLRGYGWAGYHPGDVTVHFWGVPVSRKPGRVTRAKIELDHVIRREHYFTCAVMSEENMLEVVRAIRRLRPRAFICYTQSGAELARYINREGLRDWSNIAVVCGAEKLYPADRAEFQTAFGPGVFETYGCREFMLIGTECDHHDGLHTSMENLVVEVLVDDHGKVRHAREGEEGELAVTDLHNYGMPFIRYLTGDRVRLGTQARCGCGRALPKLAGVDGRSADLLRDKNGATVSGLIFNVIFTPLAQSVRRFQVVQKKDLSVTLRVIRGEDTTAQPLEEARRMCVDLLKGVPVTVEEVTELPTGANGKRRIVIVERD